MSPLQESKTRQSIRYWHDRAQTACRIGDRVQMRAALARITKLEAKLGIYPAPTPPPQPMGCGDNP